MCDEPMYDDEEGMTDHELALIAQGIRDLGLIDARMTALMHSLLKYPDQEYIATGVIKEIMDDAADLVLAWQEFSATEFGALFDPRVDKPEEDA